MPGRLRGGCHGPLRRPSPADAGTGPVFYQMVKSAGRAAGIVPVSGSRRCRRLREPPRVALGAARRLDCAPMPMRSRPARPAARPRPRRGGGVAARRRDPARPAVPAGLRQGAPAATHGAGARGGADQHRRRRHRRRPHRLAPRAPAPAPRSSRPPRRPSASTARPAAPPGSRRGSTLGRRRQRSTGCRRRRSSSTAARLDRRLEVELAGRRPADRARDPRARPRRHGRDGRAPARSPTSGASAAAAGSSTPRRCALDGDLARATAGAGDARRRPGARHPRPRRARRRGPARRGPRRCSPGSTGVTAAASAKPGVLIVRFLAADARALARRR